jgi:galactitol-specific phosphotransferase system IIB component
MSIVTVPTILHPSAFGSGGTNAVLDAVDEFMVAVIQIPKTGTLKKIGWRSGSSISGSSYTLKISLETVASTVGQPVAITNADKTLYATGAESADIINISESTNYYTEINGSTGISVTQGDLIAITWRLIAVSASSISVGYSTVVIGSGLIINYCNTVYVLTYLGSTWTRRETPPLICLEYSDGIVPTPFTQPPASVSNLTYNSGSATPYTGIKFKYPVKFRLSGIMFWGDIDSDVDIYLYDSDGYSVISGFPVTLNKGQRVFDTSRWVQVVFPVKADLLADTWYRLAIVPTTTTNIVITNCVYTSDGSYSGMDACPEGRNIVLTSRASAPSSGDHSWTDSTTDKPIITLLIDGIDTGSGAAGGGISRSKQVMG